MKTTNPLKLLSGVILAISLHGTLVAQEQEKPAEQADLEIGELSDVRGGGLESRRLCYITPRGAFALSAAGARAVYGYNSKCYSTDWEYLGSNSTWHVFKERGYVFWMAFKRVPPYEVRYSHSYPGGFRHYAIAKVMAD